MWIPAERSCIEILRSISIFKLMKELTSMRFLKLPEKYTSISLIRECIRDKKSETRVLQEGTDAPLEVSVTRSPQKTRMTRTVI